MTKSFNAFMEEIAELTEAATEANEDYGWDVKEPKHSAPTSRKVAGRAYGGSAQKDDDEDDKPAASGEKRGRGRPKGSTSGARQSGAAGKSYGGLAIHSLSLPSRK